MKLKTTYAIMTAILLTAAVVIWKLNDYYRQEKSSLLLSQLHQQTLNLKTSVSSQLDQLKNIISSYRGTIDESNINWMQLNPFFALAQVDIVNGKYVVRNLYSKSNSEASDWTKDYVLKALSLSPFSGKNVSIQLFQNKASGKFISILFLDEATQNPQQAVVLFGEAHYFQKFFDAIRSSSTNVLLTSDNVVAGHSKSEYLATQSMERNLSSKYIVDQDQIRSTNFTVISYGRSLAGKFVAIPHFVLLFIIGVTLLLLGIILYALKPYDREIRSQNIFKEVYNDIAAKTNVSPQFEKQENVQQAAFSGLETADQIDDLFTEETTVAQTNSVEDLSVLKIDQEALPTAQELFQLIGVKNESLPYVVDLAIESCQKMISEAGVSIQKIYQSYKTYTYDVDRFKKAISNVIQNSIEAKAKSIVIKVHENQNGVLILDIIDDGTGIHEGDLDKVFHPFFGTKKDKNLNKGLGLAEALSVVRRYNADMQVFNNNSTTGSTVRIAMDYNFDNEKAKEVNSSHVEPLKVNQAVHVIDNLDIDSILSLDDIDLSDENVPVKKQEILKEFTTTQFKLDQPIQINKNPEIDLVKQSKDIDHLKIQIRRPEKK